MNALDVIEGRPEITVAYDPGTVEMVQQHDGSWLRLRKLSDEYDVHDRLAAMDYLQRRQAAGEIVTGLLYVDPDPRDMHGMLHTVDAPFNALDDAALVPGAAALEKINAGLR